MKKLKIFILLGCLLCTLSACTSKEAFKKEEIDVAALQEMISEKQDFVLLIERDNCPYCQALNEYLEQSQDEHPNTVVYVLDITDLDMKKPTDEAKTLVSTTADGKTLLKIVPYFYYTPTMYRFEEGVPVEAAIGYNSSTYEISLWDVTSTIDFDTAQTENAWTFIEDGQAS
jgi:thioredoxin-related protein